MMERMCYDEDISSILRFKQEDSDWLKQMAVLNLVFKAQAVLEQVCYKNFSRQKASVSTVFQNYLEIHAQNQKQNAITKL